MIHRDRSKVTPPEELTGGEQCPGFKERARTLEFFASRENAGKAYDKWKAYKLPGVIRALNELFHGKCAYCESNIGATQPTDVEHFRPKSGFAVRDPAARKDVLKKPGYYWLAATWENLLPSCIDCNRERTQAFPDEDPATVGKANKFPVAGERTRATGPDFVLKREKRLLLDPCEDAPEEYLEFTEEGIVRPASTRDKIKARRAKESIKVFALQRVGLVQARQRRAIEVLNKIQSIRFLEKQLNRFPDDAEIKAQLIEEIARLKGYMDEREVYSAMAVQLVKKVYGRIPG